MWLLPKLQWKDSSWRLPLSERSAAILAAALLEEPASRLRKISQLLSTEPSLSMWVFCQAPSWRESAPQDVTEPAEWLCEAIGKGLFHVESDPNQDSPNQTSSAVELEALRKCPWFPQWMNAAAADGAADALQPAATSKPQDEAVARLLPQVIEQYRRLNTLEKQFAAELEREKLAALREFAYGASHEINNPLANIATRAQALLREEKSPERKRKLSTIAAQAFRAHEMIADMMLFAKPPAPERKSTDVESVVKQVVKEMTTEARSQSTQLEFEPASSPSIALADPTQLAVATKALLRNALEALVTGGKVTAGVRRAPADDATASNHWIEIIVRDNGPGIQPEVRRHLFDPFFSGREAGRGLGFGLAKAWRIAELHGGNIQVESEPDAGATFILRIPGQTEREEV